MSGADAIPCRGETPDEQRELDRVWFAERESTQRRAAARCEPCPIRDECLLLGLDEDAGVWGGATAAQRRQLARSLAAA